MLHLAVARRLMRGLLVHVVQQVPRTRPRARHRSDDRPRMPGHPSADLDHLQRSVRLPTATRSTVDAPLSGRKESRILADRLIPADPWSPVRLIDMDKAALQDLFDYTGFAWEELKATVPDDYVLVAEAPCSGWSSLRNCFAHTMLAYGRWVPAIVELKSLPMPNMAPDDILTWAQMNARRRRPRD